MPAKKNQTGRQANSRIIGVRLPTQLAIEVKAEAARRNIALNKLFLEMWDLYQQQARKK